MPTHKASVYTLAQFAKTPDEKTWFYEKFNVGNINDKDKYGSGLLHYAIAGRNFDIALFLIDKKIDLSIVDSANQTALHTLVQVRFDNEHHDSSEKLNVAGSLLKHGIDVDAKDKWGNTALWYACHFSNVGSKDYRMVKLLLKYSPDINHKNNVSKSPLDLAKDRGYKNLQEILEDGNVK